MDHSMGGMDHGSSSGGSGGGMGGMGGMDHSGSSGSNGSSSMGDMAMKMVFQNSHTTPLYSDAWTPSTNGQYAGTCIFLIILAIILRCLLAFKALLEQRWVNTAYSRRYVVVSGQTPESERVKENPNANTGSLITAQGVEENVKIIHKSANSPIPWRFSVDIPRAILVMIISGVGYLL